MLSLHQRAAGEQPYDGRFAANINDGEFLCPLCKQLSNILIPRDTRCSSGQALPMDASQIAQRNVTSRSLRRLLAVTRFQSNPVSPLTRKALEDFGSHLHAAMIVPWERLTAAQKVKQERWHTSIHKWDFEEGDGDPMQTETSSIKNVMRLLRQQLISWASVGHSAAALEAGSRGVAVALPFGTVFETSDPWPEYNETSIDTHPMMLELKRSLTGSSGLLEILLAEVSDSLGGRKMNASEISVIGSCLADIVDGTSLLGKQVFVDLTKSSSDGLWGGVSALISAMPSHVARDGTITLRSEAKATAAAMWAVKGVAFAFNGKTEPPAPFAVRQFFAAQNQSAHAFPPDWGTMCPFVEKDPSNLSDVPFRAGVACGFLYTPLLAWDLYTLAGALFSFVLANEDCNVPTGEELLNLAHTLLIGRIVQAVITPGAFDKSDEMELDDEDCWSADEIEKEGFAASKLVSHCYDMVKGKAVEGRLGKASGLGGSALLAEIGRAILPFARAIVLVLRACTSCIRERRERNGSSFTPTEADKILVSSLCKGELLTVEDGFHVVKALQCPRLSGLLDGPWFALINRWILCTVGLENFHGFIGRGTAIPDFPLPAAFNPRAKANIAPQRPITPMVCDDSSDDHMITDPLVEGDFDEIDPLGTMRLGGMDELLQGDMDDSDEEFTDSPDDGDEMISFELPSRLTAAVSDHGDGRNSSDNSTESPDGDVDPSDRKFANVANTPILPYQPSLLGTMSVGPGRRGSAFDFALANELMVDMSHLGCVHRKDSPTFSLIRLPKSFVELYNIVNKIKGRDDNGTNDENDEIGTSETSICLLTGAVMRSGSGRRMFSRHPRPPGACTLHARKTASGIGIFFLVQKCTVLLMHNNKSAYSPSLYVDEHGEEDPQLKRGRPLFLNEARYRALELLWRQQSIPREVAQIRSTSDRVIRDNWY
jgi:Proteolysis_6 C-terminal